jgi:hypothetical protein
MIKNIDKYNEQLCALIASKQDLLISGDNIKTINGQSLLGSGDIPISGGGGTLVALPFTTDHITATGNPYLIGDMVWYLGNVYRCLANNDSILPTNAVYWTNLGAGFPLVQQPSDWNATSGNNQILNKPTFVTNVTATSPITSSGGATPVISTSINTNKLIGRSTAGVGVMEEITIGSGLTLSGGTLTAAGGGITIGTTAISSGTVNRILFEGAGNVVQQDAGFVWNNTDKRLILGADQASVDTNPRLVVVGKNPSGTTTLAAFHNSTGNSNALVIRDNGFVGIGTNAPTTPLTIGNPLGTSFTALNNTGTNSLSSRIDQNNTTTINIRNATSGTNAYVANVFESTINGSPGQSRLLVAALSNATTNEYVGGEGNSAVIYYKHLGNTTDAKMKFAVTDATSVNNIKFEWISKLQSTASNDLISGIGAVGSYTPSMTLLGNGNLLLGTVTDASSRLRILGAGITSSTFGLQVHNSTGNNNALVVRDDGKVMIGTTTPQSDYDLTIEKSLATALVGISIRQLSATGNAGAAYNLIGNNGNGRIIKAGGGYNSKFTKNNDLILFNDSNGGNICLLADASSGTNQGEIQFGAGGSSTAQMILRKNGTLDINTTENASAILNVASTTKGFLPPRMTNAERLLISSPAIGLIVYCTDIVEGLYIYKSTGWTFII